MTQKEREFVKTVRGFYRRHGRHSLPWRHTHDPYRILVSETMLQQTQVERVIPKYEAFIKKFPSERALARVSLGDVLRLWQGLGYNRRARMLHEAAKQTKSVFPNTFEELQKLPGVGRYTAGAVMAFAYNKPIVMIETNIRSVYLYHFFKNKDAVLDSDILRIIERTLDQKNPREWYAALMDYGAHLKKEIGNQNVRSHHYKKQSAFKGSNREVRGAILRTLALGNYSEKKLIAMLEFDPLRTREQLAALVSEGLARKQGRTFRLP